MGLKEVGLRLKINRIIISCFDAMIDGDKPEAMKVVDNIMATFKESLPKDDEYFSNCCGVPITIDDNKICPKCKEHCGWENEDGGEVEDGKAT